MLTAACLAAFVLAFAVRQPGESPWVSFRTRQGPMGEAVKCPPQNRQTRGTVCIQGGTKSSFRCNGLHSQQCELRQVIHTEFALLGQVAHVPVEEAVKHGIR
jgi:hypothetical protein